MKIFNKIKKNRTYFKKEKNNGFVLLFTVVLVSIILAITIGVVDIALNEVNFTTSGKDTNDAFFAADTGVECALYYDYGLTASGSFPNNSTAFCAGSALTMIGNNPWTFSILNLGTSGQACAIVKVTKDAVSSQTTIVSKGYNNGGTGDCGDTANYVQRELDVIY